MNYFLQETKRRLFHNTVTELLQKDNQKLALSVLFLPLTAQERCQDDFLPDRNTCGHKKRPA